MSYRDRIRAAAERIAIQRQDMRRKRAVLTEQLMALLPSELTARLRAVEGVLVEAPVTADNLDDVEAQIDDLAHVLDSIGERIPDIERSLDALPRSLPDDLGHPRIPPVQPWGAHMDSGSWTQGDEPKGATWERPLEWIRHYIHALDADAKGTFDRYYVSSGNGPGIEHWHRRARFRADSMPVDLLAWNANLTLTAPVRLGTPHLFVRPELWLDSLAKRFWGRRDAQLGDWGFDERFLVDADDATAHELLGPAVRENIMIMSRFDEPTLSVQNGLCGLNYVSDGSRAGFDAAIDLLGRIHRAKVDVKLLRAED